jgi:hypothetical protein
MPPQSSAQRRLFRWAEANPKAAAKRGIKPGVAKEFNDSDTGGKLPEHKPKSRADRAKARYGSETP